MPTTEFKTIKGLGAGDEPLSFNHIKSFASLNSHLANFLKAFASEDVYYRKWEFDGNAVIDDFWTFSADAGATGFDVPVTQELGGIVSGATGAVDNNAISMIGVPVIKGDKRAYFHCHFKVSAVTDLNFEVGLVDIVTDRTAPVITDVDTPASGNGATNLAVVHMDTDQTLKTMAFCCDGSTSGMDCTKSNIATLTPTADTQMCVRILVDGNDAICEINSSRTYRKSIAGEVEGGTLLRPWLFFRTRVGTTRTVKVDMVEIMGEKD